MELITKAVLMLGGEGRRLRPLTETIPKPMLKVGGVPILEIIVQRLITAGIREFYFCVNYLSHVIKDYFENEVDLGVEIKYIEESFRMGTVGALKFLDNPEGAMGKSFLLMNGDLYTDLDFNDFFANFRKSEADFYICSREEPLQFKYGVLELDGVKVRKIDEKPTIKKWINCGIYACKPIVFNYIPLEHYFDVTHLINELMSKKRSVKIYKMKPEVNWIDVGTPADYQRLEKFMENEEWTNPQL